MLSHHKKRECLEMSSDPFQIIQKPRPVDSGAGEIDPVCHMTVDPPHAAGTSEYEGRTYYFCSKGCVARFEADPEKYLDPHRLKPVPRPEQHRLKPVAAVEYTCPMHPEVRQIGPGVCPKC